MTSTAARPVNASAVSRALTTAGLVTSHAERRFRFEGVFVSKGVLGAVTVNLDLDTASHRRTCADRAVEVLEAKGYAVARSEDDHHLTVTRSTPAEQAEAHAAREAVRIAELEVAVPSAHPFTLDAEVLRETGDRLCRDCGDDRDADAHPAVALAPVGDACTSHYAVGSALVFCDLTASLGHAMHEGAHGGELVRWSSAQADAQAQQLAELPAARFAVGERVTDAPDGTGRRGDVVAVELHGHEGYAVRVIWDGSDGAPRQYSEDYLTHLDERHVADDEQLEVGAPVRVRSWGYGARRLDVGRWGTVVEHVAGQRVAVELAASNARPLEVRRLDPTELILEAPTTEAPTLADVLVESGVAAALELEPRFACVQHGHRVPECGPECDRLTAAYYADAPAPVEGGLDVERIRADVLSLRTGEQVELDVAKAKAADADDELLEAPAGWSAYGRRRNGRTVGVVHLIPADYYSRDATACGRPLARGAIVLTWERPTCTECVGVAQAANSAPVELGYAATLEHAAALEAERRRGGHPGPARRTTSLRLTDEQYSAIGTAVAVGYGDGLNAVLARLVDEHLAPVVAEARARWAAESRDGVEGGAR